VGIVLPTRPSANGFRPARGHPRELTFGRRQHTVRAEIPRDDEVPMRTRTTLAALAILTLVACAEEAPPPAPKPAVPPITADEVASTLSGALGGATFAEAVAGVDARLAAMTDAAAVEKGRIARDRVLARAFLLAAALPDLGAFVAPLAKGNVEAAAFRTLDELGKRDPESAAKVDTWSFALRSVKDASLPVMIDTTRAAAWAGDADPLVTALRLYAVRRLGDELAAQLKAPEAQRWEALVRRFGPLACPECLKARETGVLDATWFLKAGDAVPSVEPLGDPALVRATRGASSTVLVALLSRLGPLASLAVPENADPFTRKLGDAWAAWRAGFDTRAYPLTLPFVTGDEPAAPAPAADAAPAPTDKPAAAAATPPAKPTYVPSVTLPASPANQPLAVLTVRADGVWVGTRPILQVEPGRLRLRLPDETYPGVRAAETKDLAALLAAKEPGDALSKGGAFAAVVAELTRQRALLAAAVPSFHASLPAADFTGPAEARVLVSIEAVGDPKILPGIFHSLDEAGYSVVELVVGATHTPYGVPALLAWPDVLARETAPRPADTHVRPLLVVPDARGVVGLYPPDGRKAGATEPARSGETPEPAGARKIANPDKSLFRVEVPATTPDFEEKLAGTARWLQAANKAAPLAVLGVARGGDWTLLAPLANVLAHRVEAASRAAADAPALHTGAITCAPTVACNGTFLLLDPTLTLPQPGKAPVKATVVEERQLGFCAKEGINKVVMGRMGALKFCYEKELQTYPDLEGKVTMTWTIEEDGAVSGVGATDDTLKSKRVTECLSQTISKLKFDKPQGGICVVRWPFVFKM